MKKEQYFLKPDLPNFSDLIVSIRSKVGAVVPVEAVSLYSKIPDLSLNSLLTLRIQFIEGFTIEMNITVDQLDDRSKYDQICRAVMIKAVDFIFDSVDVRMKGNLRGDQVDTITHDHKIEARDRVVQLIEEDLNEAFHQVAIEYPDEPFIRSNFFYYDLKLWICSGSDPIFYKSAFKVDNPSDMAELIQV